jgi:CMP/dCMP kinase
MAAAPVIAVDGPSGVGKGTLCHLLAAKLGWHFLDSGALYRVTGQACLIEGVSWDDHPAVTEIARHLDVSFTPAASGEILVAYRGQDVSAAIRTEEGGRGASTVAAIPAVREALLARQQEMRPRRLPRSRRCARHCSNDSARSVAPPVWSRTVVTWARSCFPMRH